MSEDLTPLQADIKEMIEAFPELDDKAIAAKVWSKNHPGEPYEGREPSFQYVGKMRKRLDIEGQPPEITVERPERPEIPEEEEIEEKETLPFEQAFEPPEEIMEEEEEPEPVEGFTPDDVDFLLIFTFDKFADWSGWEGWRFKTDSQGNLTDRGEIRFARLTHRMADKYLPDILETYFLEVMFCYTAIMIVGGKASGYMKWRKAQKPIAKKVESTIIEKEQPTEPEIPEAEGSEPSTEAEPEKVTELPPGARAAGEAEFIRRVRRTPR